MLVSLFAAALAAQATAVASPQPVKPKMECRFEETVGTRIARRRICTPVGEVDERHQREVESMLRDRAGAGQPRR